MNARFPGRSPLDLQRGEEELARALAGLRQRIEAHTEEFFRDLEEALTRPISEAFARAHQAHSRLLEESGLVNVRETPSAPSSQPEETPPPSPSPGVEPSGSKRGTEGTRLRRYRNGVRVQVLEPLREGLRATDIGRVLADRWVGFQDGLSSLAEGLPEVLIRPEPQTLYRPRNGEGRITAFRKSAVRGWRGAGAVLSKLWLGTLRVFRRPVTPPAPRVQRVPLRGLARECLLGHCPLALEPFTEALQQHYAGPLARLEIAVASWTANWFSAEDRAYRNEGHLGVRFLEELFRDIQTAEGREPGSSPPEEPGLEDPAGELDGQHDEELELEGVWSQLSDALAAGTALDIPSRARLRIEQAMAGEWEYLQEEIRVSGSFQKASDGRKTQTRIRRRMERGKARALAWGRWHLNALERAHLGILLLRLREDFEETESHLMGRIVEEALSPIGVSLKEAQAGLHALQEEMESEPSAVRSSRDAPRLAEGVEHLLGRAQSLLESGLSGVLDSTDPSRVVRSAADAEAGRLSDSLRFLPESILVPSLQSEEDRVVPTVSVRDVAFREMVRQTMDVLRLEAIRNSPQPILEFLATAAAESAELPTILSYNLTAAKDELRSPPEGPWDPVLEDARNLTLDGLARIGQGVRGLLGDLGDAWKVFTKDAHDLLQESFREIHTRAVAEGAVQEQMLGLRALLRYRTREGVGQLLSGVKWLERRLSRVLRRSRIWGARLVRLGRKAVGDQLSQEGDAERAFKAFHRIPELLDSLPLVYRRLYSLQPVSEPGLLVGREDQLEWVGRRLEAWKAGYAGPSLLSGPVGVGHTSLLNVLAATSLEGYRTYRLALNRRIRTEEELASLLAQVLEIEGDAPWTLLRVGRQIEDPAVLPEPIVVLLEHTEHLFLRIPGGTNLLEDFLSFQARTARRIFWLSTSSGATWKILEKSEPNAVNLVTHHAVPTLSREATERAIMARHRRSGLPVEFVQPGDLNPLVRRRLRLSRGETAKQQILRGEFFDRLHRMSEGSTAMAILLWLRSTDFASREGRLRIRPPQPIRFAFMEGMDLTLDFALKAFLEHGSLTMEEYGEVFGTSPEEAYQVMEALRSRILLEPTESRGKPPSQPEGVREGERYRLRGILSQVVANRLKNRNILH